MEYRGFVTTKNQKPFMVRVLSIDYTTTPTIYFTKDELGNQSYYTANELILMQNTHLKDAEGNEIFEGDLLYSDHYKDIRFKVRGVPGGFVINTPVKAWENHKWPTESLGDEQTKSWIKGSCVIIGNIYQDI